MDRYVEEIKLTCYFLGEKSANSKDVISLKSKIGIDSSIKGIGY